MSATERDRLDQQMHQVLLELMLVSNGTTQSWNPSGGPSGTQARPGQGHPEGRPAGGDQPPHDYYARQYDLQETDEGRREIIKDARNHLRFLAGQYERNTTGETPEQHRARLLVETAGWSPEDVERSAWRTSAQLVRKWRTADGRWPETGHKIEPAPGTQADVDKRAECARMKQAGYTQRQVAMLLATPKSTIADWWKQAA